MSSILASEQCASKTVRLLGCPGSETQSMRIATTRDPYCGRAHLPLSASDPWIAQCGPARPARPGLSRSVSSGAGSGSGDSRSVTTGCLSACPTDEPPPCPGCRGHCWSRCAIRACLRCRAGRRRPAPRPCTREAGWLCSPGCFTAPGWDPPRRAAPAALCPSGSLPPSELAAACRCRQRCWQGLGAA